MLGLEQNAQSSTCYVSFANKSMAGKVGRSDMSGRQEQFMVTSTFDGAKKPRSTAPIIPAGVKTKALAPSPRVELINVIERNHRQALDLLLRQREGGQTHMPLPVSPSPTVQWTQQQSTKIPPAPSRIPASTPNAYTACSASVPPQVKNSLYILQSRMPSTQRFHPYSTPLYPKGAIPSNRTLNINTSAHLLSQGRRKLQAPGPSTDGLVGYFHPESSPAEECLWSANFFGHSSVSQLTYTLVYLLGKILCIRSGAELRAMHLWNTLKLFPMHKLPQHNQKVVMEYELHYTLPPDPPIPPPALYENSKRLLSLSERAGGNRFLVILDHILVKTQKGFVIKHSVKNNHQRCLVCLHALLLQKRSCSKRSLRVDNYFLSWMDSSPSARFLTDPLSDVALSTIVYDIRVVLTSLQQYLQRGPVPLETNLWSIFAQGQQFAGSPSQQSRPVLAGHGEECSVPLDLSVRGRAHPKCLDFWPEVTRRARHGVWQCADCKSCSVCKNKEAENVILICEACDKGFHGNCHSPVVPEKSANQTTPWVCSGCQAEGYCVHVGNVSSSAPVSTPSSADLGVSSLAISTSEGVMSTSSMNSKPNQPSTTAMMTTTAGSVDPLLAEPTGVTVPENSNVPIPIKESETKASAKPVSTLTTADLPGPLPMEEGEKNGEEREDAEEDDSMPPNLGTPHHDPPASEMPLLQTDSGRPEDVRLWTVDHVADWLREQGGFEKEAEAFRHQDIDGTSLLLLKSMSLLTGVGIKMGPAIKICDRIKHLQLLQARVESRSVG
ncbi:Histone acetyltransferase KAT6B [Echinococcus granulosus]|nr:Histone acetyltransferase KAT6B [Echinococcus granulosus]